MVIGKKIAKVALASESIAGKAQRQKVIHKVSRRTFMISIICIVFVCAYALVGGLSYVGDSIPYFLGRHYLYRTFEIILIAFMVIILHKKQRAMDRTNSSKL